MNNRRWITRCAALLGLLMGCTALTSCISVVEHPHIGDTVSLPSGKNLTLHYHVQEFDDRQGGMKPKAFVNEVANELAEVPLFSSVINTAVLPDKGSYLVVKGEKIPPSWLFSVFYPVSYLTAYIIPSYDSGSGFVIRYELYEDGVLKKEADYKFMMKSFFWIGLFPLVLARHEESHAVSLISGITRDFIQNSYMEGYLE